MVGDILQPTHLLFVLAVALLVLGPKRLPEVGRTLGSGIRDFRNALSDSTPERPSRPEPAWVEAPLEPAPTPVARYEQREPEAVGQPTAVAMEPTPTDAPPQLMLTPQPAADAAPAAASSSPSEPVA